MSLSNKQHQAMLYSVIETTPVGKCFPKMRSKTSHSQAIAPAPLPRNIRSAQRPLPKIQQDNPEVSKQSSADSFGGSYRGK